MCWKQRQDPFWSQRCFLSRGRNTQRAWHPSLHCLFPVIGIFHDILHPLKTLLRERGMAKSDLQRRWVCRIFTYWFSQVLKICLHIHCPFSHKTVCSQLLNASPRCVSGKHHLPWGLSFPSQAEVVKSDSCSKPSIDQYLGLNDSLSPHPCPSYLLLLCHY